MVRLYLVLMGVLCCTDGVLILFGKGIPTGFGVTVLGSSDVEHAKIGAKV